MARPYCIGLTGGVGAGKSTVAACFSHFGVEIVDTDAIAHLLTTKGGVALPDIAQAFGQEVITADGSLNRGVMRAKAFADRQLRRRLEDILHPLIHSESERAIGHVKSPYAMLVVPLLAETFPVYRDLVDRVLVVDCDQDQQIARTATRPGVDQAQAQAIVAAQASRSSRLALADDVIDNRAGLADLKLQVSRLHRTYLVLASGYSR